MEYKIGQPMAHAPSSLNEMRPWLSSEIPRRIKRPMKRGKHLGREWRPRHSERFKLLSYRNICQADTGLAAVTGPLGPLTEMRPPARNLSAQLYPSRIREIILWELAGECRVWRAGSSAGASSATSGPVDGQRSKFQQPTRRPPRNRASRPTRLRRKPETASQAHFFTL